MSAPRSERPSPPRRLYLIIGLVIGAVWFFRGDAPAWEHALRAVILLVVALPAAQLLLVRRFASSQTQVHLRHVRIIVAKLTLVAAALIAQVVLEAAALRASLVVGIGIAVTVATVGPKLHPLFVKRTS